MLRGKGPTEGTAVESRVRIRSSRVGEDGHTTETRALDVWKGTRKRRPRRKASSAWLCSAAYLACLCRWRCHRVLAQTELGTAAKRGHPAQARPLGLCWKSERRPEGPGGRKGLRTPGCSPLLSPLRRSFTSIQGHAVVKTHLEPSSLGH